MSDEGFTVQEAAQIVGASERNIRFWSGPSEVVTPAVANPRRRRTPRLFSRENLLQLAVGQALSDYGIGLDVARGAVREMSERQQGRPSVFQRLRTNRKTKAVLMCGRDKEWWWFVYDDENPGPELNRYAGENIGHQIEKSEATIVIY